MSRFHTVSPRELCSHIARAILGTQPDDAHTLGHITLHRHQQDAVHRLTHTIAQNGGALLADAVGLGKTYVALAVARECTHVHVIAPATLLPMWRRALGDTHTTNHDLHSLQSLSRQPLHACTHAGKCLVIIDEAHHLRTRNTIRYRNAAQFTANHNVLLLSATPLHNRPRDLQNLLALFLGSRADALDTDSLAQLIVRRSHSHNTHSHNGFTIPAVREHPPLRVPENPPVLEALLALPPPLPAKDGVTAGALIRLGLLRAWCSSDAALTDTIRRRQLRGEAMLHALANGRHPTHRELQSWIIGHESIQLGFPELLVSSATGNAASLMQTLAKHLDALHDLLQRHTHSAHADPERAALLRQLLAHAPPHAPIIAFSHFASTVRALHRALSDIAGIASLTSAGGRIASGTITRHELIAQFSPSANSRPPPPPHQAIQLLLTTDLLSEGVNLQDAQTMVHLDLPWTDARRIQRVGRLARLGNPHPFVNVFTFEPPPGIDNTLRIVATLEQKARASRTLVGHNDTADDARTHESAPDLATRLHDTVADWLRDGDPHPRAHHSSDSISVAFAETRITGFIALLAHHHSAHIVTSMDGVINESRAQLMRVIDAMTPFHHAHSVDAAEMVCDKVPDAGEMLGRVRARDTAMQSVSQWLTSQVAASATGPRTRTVSAVQAATLRLLSERVAATPAALRASIAPAVAHAERVVNASRGAGAENAMERWMKSSAAYSLPKWLEAIGEYPALASFSDAVRCEVTGTLPVLRAILLLSATSFRQ